MKLSAKKLTNWLSRIFNELFLMQESLQKQYILDVNPKVVNNKPSVYFYMYLFVGSGAALSPCTSI